MLNTPWWVYVRFSGEFEPDVGIGKLGDLNISTPLEVQISKLKKITEIRSVDLEMHSSEGGKKHNLDKVVIGSQDSKKTYVFDKEMV